MNAQMVLLRAVHGSWEGWRCMALDELLVGMVLPPPREQMPN
jgi:hypothetical protein